MHACPKVGDGQSKRLDRMRKKQRAVVPNFTLPFYTHANVQQIEDYNIEHCNIKHCSCSPAQTIQCTRHAVCGTEPPHAYPPHAYDMNSPLRPTAQTSHPTRDHTHRMAKRERRSTITSSDHNIVQCLLQCSETCMSTLAIPTACEL